MKIYTLLGHPDADSFNGILFSAFCGEASKCGHEVRIQRVGDLSFDPILRKGYKAAQDLEPDLVQAQENILWCELWVIFYPVWWGSTPALLKGYLDRVLLPGFAFRYHKKGPFWDKLLQGRSAYLISTCDAPGWWVSWKYRNSDLGAIKEATLKFCGFKPVRVKRISRLKYQSQAERHKIIESIKRIAYTL